MATETASCAGVIYGPLLLVLLFCFERRRVRWQGDSVESELFFFSVILISFSLYDIRERENVSDSVMECE